MPVEFSRKVIMVSERIDKYFKYADIFQITSLYETNPEARGRILHFPLVLEYNVNIDENKVESLILDMEVEAPITFKRTLLLPSFHINKVHEIKILLTLFTHSIFFEYNTGAPEQAWFSSFDDFKVHWGQKRYDTGNLDALDPTSFSSPNTAEFPRVQAQQYYDRKFYRFPGQTNQGEDFTLPDNIESLFDAYYSLEPEAKRAFYQASNLFYQAMDIWSQSHSLSYTALISSLETLIQYDHRNDHSDKCCTCGTTQYHVRENFRSFLGIEKHNPILKQKRFVNDLYDMRCDILHRGYLLLSDLHMPGYESYQETDEFARMRNLVTIVKIRLINWLLST